MAVVGSTSAGLDRAGLRDRVRKLTEIRSADLLADVEINQRLSEAYAEINSLADWGAIDTVYVSGAEQVTALPHSVGDAVDPLEVVATKNDDAVGMSYLPQTEFEMLPDADGRPSRYTVKANGSTSELWLWPAPENGWTLSIVYADLYADALDDDTDRPWFAAEFHPLLAYLVAARLLSEEGDQSGRIDRYDREVTAFVGQMRSRYLARKDRRLVRMGRPAGRRAFGTVRR